MRIARAVNRRYKAQALNGDIFGRIDVLHKLRRERVADVKDHHVTDPRQADEGIGAAIDDADGHTLGFGAFVVAAAIEARCRAAGVEQGRSACGGDAFEQAAAVVNRCTRAVP